MSLPLRQLEGKYDILHKIKEGGMGAIYKVRHLLLEEARVIKVIRPQFAGDDNLQRRFLREARMAIRLRHANIAQIYDFAVSDEDGTSFIVMEYIDGVTLQEVLRKSGPPPLGLALEVAHQGLSALAYLHHQGYIHRDISPDNLMLSRDFRGAPLVKLIDLGIAKQLDTDLELTQTGMFMGKVRYAPPEQFSGREGGGPEQDHRSDVYSFGILLYELLTGICPIIGESVSELIAAHLFNEPLPFAEADPDGRIPPELRSAVFRALEKSPDDRFADADEFIAALAPIKAGRSASPDDLEKVLHETTTVMAETADHPQPGSTQNRLNRQFNPVTTPQPTVVPEPTPAIAGEPEETEEVSDTQPGPQDDPAVVVEIAFIKELMEQGELARAEERLAQLQAAHDEASSLLQLRVDLEARRRDSIAAAERSIAGALTEGDVDLAARELEFAQARYGDRPELQTLHVRAEQLRAASAVQSAGAGEPGEEPMTEMSDLAISHPDLELASEDSSQPSRSPRLRWAVAALLAVAVTAGLVWWQITQRSTLVPSPTTSNGSAAAVPATGILLLNALPWGRVESITDAAGAGVALGAESRTPLRLSLPAGSYTVSLVNPRTASQQEVELEIRAAETTRTTVELASVDVESYLERVLLGPLPPGSR